jgi:hypothetical protein
MLDDVERRTFLVEPSGEDPAPLVVGPLHVELHERAGQLLILPRRAGFAGAQADDGIADPHRLSRLQRDVADDPVAFVEEAEDGHPFRHRSHAGVGIDGFRNIDRYRILVRPLDLRRPAVAGGRRRQKAGQTEESRRADHAYSGVQAW